jgi:CheY-like chemotaxis protein
LRHKISEISTILFIDDDPDILELLKESVEDMFLKVYTASSARKGIEILSQHKIDCVITDYAMPEMNGLMFVDYIKGIHPSLPIIILTGHSNSLEIFSALEDRVYDIITKPFQKELLVNRISCSLIEPMYESLLLQVAGSILPDLKIPNIFNLSSKDRSKYLIQLDSLIRSKLLTKNNKNSDTR